MKKSVKILISLLALILMLGCTISAAGVLSGDLNGDDSVNSADAIYLLRHTIMPGVYPINQSGDMNGDGNTNGADALYLLRHTILPEKYPLKQNSGCAHREVVDPAVAPTCSAPGLTEGKHCENCLMIFIKQETVDPLPHSFEKAICKVCGADAPPSEGLVYTLSEDGTYYVVTGIGECQDPCVVIPGEYNGLPVKAIGYQAFEQCYHLREVILPDGMTEIGAKAFYITGLSYISIPESVTTIGKAAFYGSPSLTEIILPRGLTEISDDLFSYCYQLQSVTIPENVKKIGESAFFSCIKLDAILLPDGITEIGVLAFAECASLKEIRLPKDLYTIERGTFSYCYALASVEFPENLMQIDEDAFYYCSSLTNVTIPTNVQVISASTFANCSSLTSIVLPQTLESIGKGSFTRSGLVAIEIPDSVSSIGQGAFEDCRSLQYVRLPDMIKRIDTVTFRNCVALESIVISDGVSEIKNEAFQNCSALRSVTLPSTIRSLQEYSFAGCSALEEIVFEGSDGEWMLISKENGWNADTGEYTLTCLKQPTITDDLIYSLHTTGAYYVVTGMRDSDMTDIIIPATYQGLPVLEIADGAFENNDYLVSVTIEEGIRSIGAKAFYYCPRLFSVDMASTVETVGAQAFACCDSLYFVNIPDGLTEIADGVFEYCRKLSDVSLPTSVTRIGDGAFRDCTALTIYLHDGLESIGAFAFCACRFEELIFPESLQSIGESAFYGCYELKNIVLPSGLMELKANVFAMCTSLHTVTLPQDLVAINEGAFSNCQGLSAVTIPKGVGYIGSGVFRNITQLAISYEGTKYGWSMIEKASGWDSNLTYTLTFEEADVDIKDVYDPNSYSSDYAYRYLGTLSKGEALQKFYNMMDKISYYFHNGNTDVQPMENSNGQYGILSILDFQSLGLTPDEANSVWVAYGLDHPIYYWIGNAIALSDTSLYFLVNPDYFLASVRADCNQKIYSKIAEWTALVREEYSAYQIALAYHDLIISEINYAYEADGRTPQDDSWAHSIVGVLCGNGEGVCESYAKTFHLLLNYSDVENVYVNGYANGGHSWNMVRLEDGNWYWCDLTWDDNPSWAWGIDYHYFCVNDTQNINWYYQDGGYIVDSNHDGVLDFETFGDSHTPDAVGYEGMRFAYPLPAISNVVFDGTLRDTFTVNDMTYAISGYRTVQFTGTLAVGNVVIPETVDYNGVTYTVTSIGGILHNGIYSPTKTTYFADSVYIPKTVKYIWEGALGANKTILIVDEQNPYYYSENGLIYAKMPRMIYRSANNIHRPEKIRKSVCA